MSSSHNRVYLFVHIIWACRPGMLLTKPVKTILCAHMLKEGPEKGLRVLAVNGAEDHIHCLLQMHAAQNLVQVVNSLKTDTASWLNGTKLLTGPFEWENEYAAMSVSPSNLTQVTRYIQTQEDYHKTKTLASEWEVFDKLRQQ